MTDRTPGGLFLPNEEALAMLSTPRRPAKEPSGDGLLVDAGWATVFFVTDPTDWVAELDHPRVLVTSAPLDSVEQLTPLLEAVALDACPLALFAPSFSPEVLAFLVVNKLRGILHVDAVATTRTLELAAHLGASVWPTAPVEHRSLPIARKVVSGERTTLITTT